MSIPEEVWNAAWNGNWQDDEETIHRILEKPTVDAQRGGPNGSAPEIRLTPR
jgi:hypothetical protein